MEEWNIDSSATARGRISRIGFLSAAARRGKMTTRSEFTRTIRDMFKIKPENPHAIISITLGMQHVCVPSFIRKRIGSESTRVEIMYTMEVEGRNEEFFVFFYSGIC